MGTCIYSTFSNVYEENQLHLSISFVFCWFYELNAFFAELFPIYTVEFPICTRTKNYSLCQNNHKHIFAARFQVTAPFLLLPTSNSQVGLFMELAMLHRLNVTLPDLYLLNWKRKRRNGMETERFGMLSVWLSHSVVIVIQNSV